MADHSYAIGLLEATRQGRMQQAKALDDSAEYAQAQIDYDREHRPENKKDLPRFEKDLKAARDAAKKTWTEVEQLDRSISVLKKDQS